RGVQSRARAAARVHAAALAGEQQNLPEDRSRAQVRERARAAGGLLDDVDFARDDEEKPVAGLAFAKYFTSSGNVARLGDRGDRVDLGRAQRAAQMHAFQSGGMGARHRCSLPQAQVSSASRRRRREEGLQMAIELNRRTKILPGVVLLAAAGGAAAWFYLDDITSMFAEPPP